jgi:hypothetical protein
VSFPKHDIRKDIEPLFSPGVEPALIYRAVSKRAAEIIEKNLRTIRDSIAKEAVAQMIEVRPNKSTDRNEFIVRCEGKRTAFANRADAEGYATAMYQRQHPDMFQLDGDPDGDDDMIPQAPTGVGTSLAEAEVAADPELARRARARIDAANKNQRRV